MNRSLFTGLVGLLILVTAGCAASRPGDHGSLRVMTYNIHHGEGVDGTVDIRRIADHIIAARPHVVALQEVDRRVDRSGGTDIMTELSDMTGMTYAFGKTLEIGGGEYGNGFLTVYPILEERNHLYARNRPGEQRGLLQLVIEVNGNEIVVMNTHLDHRDESERLSQIGELKAAARRYGSRPIILCGDFNDRPGTAAISSLNPEFVDAWEEIGGAEGWTFPAAVPAQRIDYVFVSRPDKSGLALRPTSGRIIVSHASDHLPVLVELGIAVQ